MVKAKATRKERKRRRAKERRRMARAKPWTRINAECVMGLDIVHVIVFRELNR